MADQDEWLAEANRQWAARAERQRIRADSAEAWASFERSQLRGAWYVSDFWRLMALMGWSWLLVESAKGWWHWPRWSLIPPLLVVPLLNTALDFRARRRRRRAQERAALPER